MELFELAYLGDAGQGCAGCDKAVGGFANLRDLVLAERMSPCLRVVLVLLCAPRSGTSDLLGEGGVWLDKTVNWVKLSTGLDSIREDLWRRIVVAVCR